MQQYDPLVLISSAALILIILLIGVIFIFVGFQSRKTRLLREQLGLEVSLQQKEIEKLQELDGERNRIYQDLHDNIGSTLAAAKLQANFLKSSAQTEELDEELAELESMIELSYEELKEIVWYANSQNDTIANLSLFIREYAQSFLEKSQIVFKYREQIKNPKTYISAGFRKDVYYSIKELLHNIIKHSEAHRAWIEFVSDPEHIQITVRDDGKGMIMKEPQANANGINSIRERVHKYSGTVNFENQNGLTVNIFLPLKEGNTSQYHKSAIARKV